MPRRRCAHRTPARRVGAKVMSITQTAAPRWEEAQPGGARTVLAEKRRIGRYVQRTFFGLLAAGAVAGEILFLLETAATRPVTVVAGATAINLNGGPSSSPSDTLIAADVACGAIFVFAGAEFGLTFIKTPTEQMAELWAKDPSLPRLPSLQSSFTLRPHLGLGSVGLSGTF
jgi:hypothetical protein